MEIKEFAKSLTGRQYYYPQFTEEEIQTARDNGFVIVYGASDDLIEFDGAMCDEGGCYEGGDIYLDSDGVSLDKNENLIKALWCQGKATWSYETDIPHETFEIYEDDEFYCEGIVFSINDLK